MIWFAEMAATFFKQNSFSSAEILLAIWIHRRNSFIKFSARN